MGQRQWNFDLLQKLKIKKKYVDLKEGLTFGGSILTFVFHLVIFDPLTNFLVSLRFGRFWTLQYLANLQENSFKKII